MIGERRIALQFAIALGLLMAAAGRLRAEDLTPGAGSPPSARIVPTPTLGGMQFWADELFFHEWRIQREAATGHCRLLDGLAMQHARGTYEECLAVLEQIKTERKLLPMQGKGVILLHGLTDSRASMARLAKFLRDEGGYEVFNVNYPSTRGSIADFAKSLANIVANLPGLEEINFVGHSMGNIVIRRYLGDETDSTTGHHPDSRIKRFVMLGPPNQGSVAAKVFAENPLFINICGKPGQELGSQWAWLQSSLAVPTCEFAIIAGGLGNNSGFNLLLSGDDDGLLTVDSTRLDGAKDFAVVPVLHAVIMNDLRVQQYTLNFLKTDRFRGE